MFVRKNAKQKKWNNMINKTLTSKSTEKWYNDSEQQEHPLDGLQIRQPLWIEASKFFSRSCAHHLKYSHVFSSKPRATLHCLLLFFIAERQTNTDIMWKQSGQSGTVQVYNAAQATESNKPCRSCISRTQIQRNRHNTNLRRKSRPQQCFLFCFLFSCPSSSQWIRRPLVHSCCCCSF